MPLAQSIADVVNAAAGIDLWGVADLAPAHASMVEQGGDEVAAYPRAVSLGIVLPHGIVDRLPQREQHAVAVSYRSHSYEIVNQRLDLAASQVASLLQRAGYRTCPVAASVRADSQRLCAVFSHKLAAHLAGLGWIGKSCLLVTPEHGPRVRWATVLTMAPLEPTGNGPAAERCGDCTACVDICPVHAFSGRPFRPEDARTVRYDATRCDAYLGKLQAERDIAVCGLCLYACPFGRKAGQKLQ